MEIAMLVIGIILLVFAVFLIVAVLMQQGKAHNLSGAIAGGAETFFGKAKGQTINKKLSVLTTIVAIVFVLVVCAVYILTAPNDDFSWDKLNPFSSGVEENMADADDKNEVVAHDHDGDGVADHAADEHVDDTTAADTTAADTTAADTTAADTTVVNE